ncbi:MAG TPA: ketopantoate reductase family protein [Blastocatellia bacterium]
MPDNESWPKVAVIGAGAVGGYFGGMMANAGAPVTMIGRKAFVDAVKTGGLLLDTLHFQKRVPIEASTEVTAASGADLVLFCVKTPANAATSRELAPLISPNAVVVSLQNGVDNVEQIRAASGIEAVPAGVYVAASVPTPGHIKHIARGDLVVGPRSEQTIWLAETFGRANIPCRITENIDGEMWAKLLLNCALNAISALGQARYGRIAESAEAWSVVEEAVLEVFAVARSAGVVLPDIENSKAAIESARKLASQMSGAMSSTAQDISGGKQTEVASLNGYVARLGAELGVPTPVNQALFALVKLLEGRDRDDDI